MRGIQGLVLAAALAAVGFVCNWLYLEQQSGRVELVYYVGIQKEAEVNRGDVFRQDHLVEIGVPRNRLGHLSEVAVPWSQRDLVVGQRASRTFGALGTELLTFKDLETPAAKDLNEQIADNERVMWLPVDSRSFNPQHVNPGDSVSFRVPEFDSGKSSRNRPLVGAGQIIGPFRILALGDRKGRRDIRQAAGLSSGAENVIAIAVKIDAANNKLEARAETLSNTLAVKNFQGVQVLLHAVSNKKNK